MEYYKKYSQEIRKEIVKMCYTSHSSHIGSALSIIDILVLLYFKYLKINPQCPYDENRDIFILSKGHASAALYAVLAYRGFFNKYKLTEYYINGSSLSGHPKRFSLPGIEASTGSLGHGLSIGTGIALANKNSENDKKVVVLLGDGECNEGSIWEAAMFAAGQKLNNLIAVVDNNNLQGLGKVEEISAMEPLYDKWVAFGWNVLKCDGHNYNELDNCLNKAFNNKTNRPIVIIMHTIKGKGISFMENKLEWHYKSPNKKELKDALKELDLS